MGFLDGLIELGFKKDSEGNTLFYPWGILGSGYVIKSDEEMKRIRVLMKRCLFLVTPFIICIYVVNKVWFGLVLLIVVQAWLLYSVKKITKGLSKSTEKFLGSDAFQNSAESFPLFILIIFEVGAITGIVALLVLLYFGQDALILTLGIFLFFLFGLMIGRMISIKLKSKSR